LTFLVAWKRQTIEVAYIAGHLYSNHVVDGLRVGWLAVFAVDIVSDLLCLFFPRETLEVPERKASEGSFVGHVAHLLRESFIKAFEAIREMLGISAALMVVWMFGAFANSAVGPFWLPWILKIIGFSGVQWRTISRVKGALTLPILGKELPPDPSPTSHRSRSSTELELNSN
jgi:hypothetical protein